MIQIDEQQIRSHVEEVVRSSVEDTQEMRSGWLCRKVGRGGDYLPDGSPMNKLHLEGGRHDQLLVQNCTVANGIDVLT